MEDKLKITWNHNILNKLIGLAYKRNHYVTIFNLRNLQRLINISDFSEYKGKSIVIKRVEFLKRTLEARLDLRYNDEDIIIEYAKGDMVDEETEEIVNNLEKYKQIYHKDIEYINIWVEDRLRYGTLEQSLSELTNLIQKVEENGFKTYSEAFIQLDAWVDKFKAQSRQIKSSLNNGILRFNDESIKDKIDDILCKLGTTQSIIVSGIQMLNDMLAPGYLGGRLYTYAALPANFKSGLLLKTAVDTIKYNAKSYRGRKEGHKKAVIYFTMENTTEESFERAFHMVVNKDDIRDFDSDFIEASMRRANLIANEDMELIMVYKPNRSISTADIRNLIEELDEDGIEVVMLCFDYLKRIRPVEPSANEKEELKNVTNELRNIAIDFDIPIVTAAQLNRQAAMLINNTVRSGKADALKEIDSSMIGSAWEILENSDVVILINMQKRKKDDKLFLSFLLCKQRYKDVDIKFFNQPFDDKTFNLEDDVLLKKPKGLKSLSTDFEDVDIDLYEKRGRKTHLMDDESPRKVNPDLFTMSPLS